MANSAQPVLLALSISLSISLVPLAAEAGRDQGGSSGGGGGRLGQVSAGLGQATGGGASNNGGGSQRDTWRDSDYYRYRDEPVEPPVVLMGAEGPVVAPPPKPTTVKVDFFAGAQKVYESDGSLSLELALNEGRFRFGGAISRYYERQQGRAALTFTLPSLYIGVRIDDGGPTRAHIEVGAIGARTRNDPAMDSSVGGVFGGVRVEHRVSRRTSVVGDAQAMVFEQDVKGAAMRAGIRFGHLQATVRYLDLNVGPALFGPEVGIRF